LINNGIDVKHPVVKPISMTILREIFVEVY